MAASSSHLSPALLSCSSAPDRRAPSRSPFLLSPPRLFNLHSCRSRASRLSSPAPPPRRSSRVQPVRARLVDWRPRRRYSLLRDVDVDRAFTVNVPRSVPVRVAHELHLAGHRYLDVRSDEEFSVGHAEGAVNVPYMVKFGTGMMRNPGFVEEVLLVFGKDAEIIVGSQTGQRSLMAATELVRAGFTGITEIAGGYEAWRQNGLPME